MNDMDLPDNLFFNEPFKVELTAGETYWWCTCGRSMSQPFCDGSHEGTTYQPKEFVAQASGEAWLCGCKQTGNAPFCDGSHENV
jgi:CDGSH-type Zn-finger protein